jgi:hypothetical protein
MKGLEGMRGEKCHERIGRDERRGEEMSVMRGWDGIG